MTVTVLLNAIRDVVGKRGLLTGDADTAAYVEDWRRLYRGRTPAVVRPATTEELAEVVRLCAEARRADGAAGRQYLDGRRRDAVARTAAQIVLSLSRLEPGPRHRPGRHDDGDRGRRHAEGGAAGGGRGRVPAAAVDLVRGHARRSAACWRPMPAATTRCATATPATWCSGWKWCCRTARSGTGCAGCARTIPATACASCSSAARARSASSPPPC